jgi:hypothetical protein
MGSFARQRKRQQGDKALSSGGQISFFMAKATLFLKNRGDEGGTTSVSLYICAGLCYF